MTGLQATKVLQSWQLSFDGENRKEPWNFLENVRDCRASNDNPTDKLLNAMPAVLKGKSQRWFHENKRDLDPISEGLRSSIRENASQQNDSAGY
uniref:Uncharacterized protein n=1 Tax=Trichogramma kaykai TaxID=54128 RepID=A0ABD2WP19_9HYME